MLYAEIDTKKLFVHELTCLKGKVCIDRLGGCGSFNINTMTYFNENVNIMGDSIVCGTLKVDNIIEKTNDHGVIIEGVLIKDGSITVPVTGAVMCIQDNNFDTYVCANNNDSVTMVTGTFPAFKIGAGTTNMNAGFRSFESITTGIDNTAIGTRTLQLVTTGNGNTAVGNLAGNIITGGSNNVFIGTGATADSAVRTGAISIGSGIVATQDDGCFIKHRNAATTQQAGFIGNELVALSVPVGPSSFDYLFAYNTTSLPITLASTWYNVTFNTNVFLNSWIHIAGSADFTCATTGLYKINVIVTFDKIMQNIETGLRFTLNNVEIPGSLQHYHMHTSATDHTVAVLDIPVNIAATNVLRVQIACDTAGVVSTSPGTGFWATQPSSRIQIMRLA